MQFRVDALLERIKMLELEIMQLRELASRYKEEAEYYKNQVEKLLEPPYIEAYIIDVLPSGRVRVRTSNGSVLIVNVAPNVSYENIRPGVAVALNQRGSIIVEVLPQSIDPYVSAFEVIERPSVSYDDIGGLDDQIAEIREVVELPLKHPELIRQMGIEPPKGVLLYGPPGCGKTLIAKAVAAQAGATFINVVASELVQKFIGEGARIVRELFELARRKKPSIVFIDEIDAIASKRLDYSTSGEREVHRTLTQLLAELDGFDPLDQVKVIAATNRIDIIDPALLRPGRFDRLIEIPLPDLRGRYEIFKIHTRRMPLDKDVDLPYLAKRTEGASGADIKMICVEAALRAIRRSSRIVTLEDFEYAIEKVMSKYKSNDKTAGIIHT